LSEIHSTSKPDDAASSRAERSSAN
jgi:hypothetical protein